jgi:hypothetical protein
MFFFLYFFYDHLSLVLIPSSNPRYTSRTMDKFVTLKTCIREVEFSNFSREAYYLKFLLVSCFPRDEFQASIRLGNGGFLPYPLIIYLLSHDIQCRIDLINDCIINKLQKVNKSN